MHDAPSSAELLTGVKDFITSLREDGLSGRNAFLARVAENALSLVQREIEQKEEFEHQEFVRLQDILSSNASLPDLRSQLVEAIRAENISIDDPALLAHLRATTVDTLKIDQPKYSALRTDELGETT